MNTDRREKLLKKLDAFIEENFEPFPPSFNAMHGGGGDSGDNEQKSEEEKEKERLEAFIREHFGRPGPAEKHFANILDDMREELDLEPSALYKAALITRFHYSRITGPDRPRPERDTVLALAFALILTDTKKNKPPKYEPNERMKILLFTGGGTEFLLRNSAIFDLVILFCIHEWIFNIDDVNYFLNLKELPLIPKTRKKNVSNKRKEPQ
jgi:hypothetical protein